jgi:3-oxoadipate enol-lactonase
MPFAKAADGTRIFYRRFDPEGDAAAPAVLAVPPLGLSIRLWEIARPRVTARGYCAIAVDNRGGGGSDVPRRPWTVRTMADDAIAVLDREGIERAHLSGPSLGGMVAQEIALRHPQRVAGLLLASTTGGLPRIDLMPVRVLPRTLVSLTRSIGGGTDRDEAVRRFLRYSVSPRVAEEQRPGDPLWRLVDELLQEPVSARGRIRQLAAGALHSTWSRLHLIRAPTQVQHGTEDRLVPPRAGRLLASRIPAARFAPIEGAGHALVLERPAEVTDMGMDFLAEHDALLG